MRVDISGEPLEYFLAESGEPLVIFACGRWAADDKNLYKRTKESLWQTSAVVDYRHPLANICSSGRYNRLSADEL